MSQSTQTLSSADESTRSNCSMLNAQAMPFMFPIPQHRGLRACAPVFVAATAAMVTPPSHIENLTNAIDLENSGDILNNECGIINHPGDSQGVINWDDPLLNLGPGNEVGDFNNLGQGVSQLRDFQNITNGFTTGQSEGAQDTDSEVVVGQLEPLDWNRDHLAWRELDIPQSIAEDFRLGLPGSIQAFDSDIFTHQCACPQSIDNPPTSRATSSGTDYTYDIDGDYESDDDYQPPMVPSADEDDECSIHYPTPQSKTNSFESVHDSEASTPDASHGINCHNGRVSNTKAKRDKHRTRNNAAIRNAGIKKSSKKTLPKKKLLEKAQDKTINNLALSISDKQKMATPVLAQQNTETDPAKKMGQDIRIVKNGEREDFEGVYWYAPQDDLTIPTRRDEKRECFRQILHAMLNTEGCKEVSTTTAFLNRWGKDATHYSMAELKIAAWDILDTMIDIHENGWTKKILDSQLRELIQKTMFFTFKDRFDGLVELLKRSKRSCADIMKIERFYTIIGNPLALETRTTSNAKSNGNKGRKLKKRGVEEIETEEGSETPVADRPQKRVRKACV